MAFFVWQVLVPPRLLKRIRLDSSISRRYQKMTARLISLFPLYILDFLKFILFIIRPIKLSSLNLSLESFVAFKFSLLLFWSPGFCSPSFLALLDVSLCQFLFRFCAGLDSYVRFASAECVKRGVSRETLSEGSGKQSAVAIELWWLGDRRYWISCSIVFLEPRSLKPRKNFILYMLLRALDAS